MDILERLRALGDSEYAAFQAKLTPNVASELFIGVRVPVVRKLAKELYKEGNYESFLNDVPHHYYDENLLHGLLISEEKNFDRCTELLDVFLPYVDNWAVCDTMAPVCFKKNKEKLIEKIPEWINSDKVYVSRFGIEALMTHFLDKDFRPEYLQLVAGANTDDYYSMMMVAWFFATALTKQWQSSIVYVENNRLDVKTHNKAIQKAVESYRISEEQKNYLRSLRRK